MHRVSCLSVIVALAVAVSVVAAGPAVAAKGGNNDAAKQCKKGGWKTLVSQTGEPFKNQGDCVNDAAQGVGVQPGPLPTPEQACLSLPGRPSFSDADPNGDGPLWSCTFASPPGPAQPTTLEKVCAVVSGGVLSNAFSGDTWECTAEGP